MEYKFNNANYVLFKKLINQFAKRKNFTVVDVQLYLEPEANVVKIQRLLRELRNIGLLTSVNRGYKGSLYSLTQEAFELAENIKKNVSKTIHSRKWKHKK